MKFAPLAVALIVPLALLAACNTLNSPGSIHTDAGKGLIVAESTLDAAVTAADTAVKAKLTTAAENASIHALTAPCPLGVTLTAAVVPQCPVVATKALAEAAYDDALNDIANEEVMALAQWFHRALPFVLYIGPTPLGS